MGSDSRRAHAKPRLALYTEPYCVNQVAHDRCQLICRGKLHERLSIKRRCHPSNLMEPQVTKTRRGCDFATQTDGIDADIGQVEERPGEVAANEGVTMTWLWIETANIVVEQAERNASSTHVAGSTTIGLIQTPGPYDAEVIAAPCRKQTMLGCRGP